MDRFYNALRQNAAVKVEKASPNARLMEALADDVNTPLALSVLHEIVNNLNKSETEADKVRYKSELMLRRKFWGCCIRIRKFGLRACPMKRAA